MKSSEIIDNIVHLQYQKEYVSDTGRKIYPEFIEYCYLLEGCQKKLLFYLIFHHVESKTGEFIFNDQIIAEFRNYNEIITNGGKNNSTGVVKSACRKLVKSNIIVNINRGKYMLNPMIMSGSNAYQRRSLMNTYTGMLLKKKKDSSNNFFPI